MVRFDATEMRPLRPPEKTSRSLVLQGTCAIYGAGELLKGCSGDRCAGIDYAGPPISAEGGVRTAVTGSMSVGTPRSWHI